MKIIGTGNWFSALDAHLDHSYDVTFVQSSTQGFRVKDDDRNLVLYFWDVYRWHDLSDQTWSIFRRLLDRAVDVWFCSVAAKRQAEKYLGYHGRGSVIHTHCPLSWLGEFPDPDIGDYRYVLCPVRHYLLDAAFTDLSIACRRLGLALIHPDHDIVDDEFPLVLKRASVVACAYDEASTGGLGLIEGAYCGKPLVITDAKLNGAKEYVGAYAHRYRAGDIDHLCDVLMGAWLASESAMGRLRETRQELLARFSPASMAKKCNARLAALAKQGVI